MGSACLDEYQYAVGWHCDLFLFGRNRRVLVLAQGFLDLLFDFEQGSVQRGGLGSDFWKVGNMGGAAVCLECAKHRIRLILDRDAVLHVCDYTGVYRICSASPHSPAGYDAVLFFHTWNSRCTSL